MILQNLLIAFFCLLVLGLAVVFVMKVSDLVRWRENSWAEHVVAGVVLACVAICVLVVWELVHNPVAS